MKRTFIQLLLAAFLGLTNSVETIAQVMYGYIQPTKEVTGSAGLSIFRGDIGAGANSTDILKIVDPTTIGFALNGGYRRYIKHGLSLRTSFTYAFLRADDSFSESIDRKNRNLNFRTSVFDWSLTAEYSIFHHFKRISKRNPHRIYLFAGVSAFYFEPKATYKGKNVELQPLGTEGQGYGGRDHYKLLSSSLVGGFGYRQYFQKNFSIGVELNLQTTFTDYIDDVSTQYPNGEELLKNNGEEAYALSYRGTGPFPDGQRRGNPGLNDYFGFVLVTFSKTLSSNSSGFLQ